MDCHQAQFASCLDVRESLRYEYGVMKRQARGESIQSGLEDQWVRFEDSYIGR
jgi:hypothetical protein